MNGQLNQRPDLVIFTEANGADCIREGEPTPEPAAQAPAQNPSLMLEGYPAYVDPQSDEAVAAVSRRFSSVLKMTSAAAT